MPAVAHRVVDDAGRTEDVPLDSLAVGDRVLVRSGEKLPADGSVVEGVSAVDESMLTGESLPVAKQPGASVIGGSVNREGSLTVEVTRTGEESFLAQVMRLVSEAQQSRSQTQDLADRAAMWLTFVALAGGVVTFVAWLVFAGESLEFAMERAVTVMVIACPHALGLAIPLVVAVSTALGARGGVLVRDRRSFEEARFIDTIIFDKTGTLTEGRFGVIDVRQLGEMPAEEALRLAAAVESRSEHPIARAIVDSIDGTLQDRPLPVAEDFLALPGRGAQARIGDSRVAVVSPGYLAEQGMGPLLRRPRLHGRHCRLRARGRHAAGGGAARRCGSPLRQGRDLAFERDGHRDVDAHRRPRRRGPPRLRRTRPVALRRRGAPCRQGRMGRARESRAASASRWWATE